MNLKDLILDIVYDKDYSPLTTNEMVKFLKADKYMKDVIIDAIKSLEKDNKIRISHKGKILALTEDEKSLFGRIELAQGSYGFFISDNEKMKDVFISKENLKQAFQGDRVKIEIIKEAENGRNAEGRVVDIIEHNKSKIIGTYEQSKNFGFVICDNKSIGNDIYIAKKYSKNAKNKDKVIVEIINIPKKGNPEGRIVEIIGHKNDKNVDIYTIIAKHDIPYQFSKETKKEVLFIDEKLKESDYVGRVDFRDLFTVTIDGRDSKDFDDAISIEKNGEDYDLYVHIADVANYVKRSTAIDNDAYDRGNSTYLYNIVVPMLPKELSNGICSLNPNSDRLTLSLKMTINNKGKVIANDFYQAVINSNYRLVYDDVNDFLDDKNESIYTDEILKEKLLLFDELYKILRAKRDERGAIDFNFTESQIDVSDDGKVLNIEVLERGSGNKMIEEFMLAANETVATLFAYMDFPFIYRIHEKPKAEKIEKFKKFLNTMGYNIRGNDLYPKDFQKILKEVEGEDKEKIVNLLMLRTMQKARYSKDCKEHFGLSTKFYTHFTSPIRRYPDLIVHRLLKAYIENKLGKFNRVSLENSLEKSSEHLSITERRSEDCEREVEDLMKCKYMRRFIGCEFYGEISSVTDFGIYIELENTVEGLFMYKFSKNHYEFIEEKLQAYDTTNKKYYNLGDRVKVRVKKIDIMKKNIDFELLEEDETVSQQQESLS
ncbi:ribonuclease R [Anaerococcus sp. Marseille-P9784]|uniref:ribonuclease R n=1 Tax=Anaerococcus sp. Marseille-P9784 TaxID=2614127 RepID=UPI001249CDCD|nr:ribonuclease R [Anaerococcus sp. Marseille-P9784]